MHDQTLRERADFEADIGRAVVLIAVGIVFMLGFVGTMAYAIGTNAAKAETHAAQRLKGETQ